MNKEKHAKRLFYIMMILLLLLTIVGLLTACDVPPIVDERCYDNYENFTFYEIERDGPLGTVESAYMFETPHGDIEVSDKIYDNAIKYAYAEICYEREDGIATSYLYTKKGQSLAPEPEIITEYVDREVEVEVPIYTHTVVETFTLSGDTPNVGYPLEGVAWIGLRIDEGDLYVIGGGETPTSERIMPEIDKGDTILLIWIYDKNIIADNTVWEAQILHIRNGIIIHSILAEETWDPTPTNSLETYVNNFLTDFDATTLQEIYETLYPPVVVE